MRDPDPWWTDLIWPVVIGGVLFLLVVCLL